MAAGDVFVTPTFRLAAIFTGTFAGCALFLFGFIYWQTSLSETSAIDRFLLDEAREIAQSDPAETVQALTQDLGSEHDIGAVIALFDDNGVRKIGPLEHLPTGLPADGQVHEIVAAAGSPSLVARHVRAVAISLSGSDILLVARDVGELQELRFTVVRALRLGLLPLFLLSLVAGAFLSWRALQRVKELHLAIERIMAGNLHERLPVLGTEDNFDQLARSVNQLLDEIERLLEQIKSMGNDIAHDLRTPLTRVRTRLERGRLSARSTADSAKPDLEGTLSSAIAGLDQALDIVTALLRISELEDSRRRAGFEAIDLAEVLVEVDEIFAPIAEERGAHLLRSHAEAPSAWVLGDRALLVEAVANVVDNAIKFTPPGGSVHLMLLRHEAGAILRVADDGPGIPKDEREAVLKRFYRSDRSRHVPGSGLGLGLVAAIVKLHKFEIIIGGNTQGCVFDIVCPSLL